VTSDREVWLCVGCSLRCWVCWWLVVPCVAWGYGKPPAVASWFWEINPPSPGLAGLPATSAAYPAPGSANIWDTDLFQDSNTANAGIPTGPSPVVQSIHAAGHYSICYVEVGAYQLGFPDNANFAPADYGNQAHQYQMQGYSSVRDLDPSRGTRLRF
jgi:hypothetical protein